MDRPSLSLLVGMLMALATGAALAADSPRSAPAAAAATAAGTRRSCLSSSAPIEVVNTGNGYRFGTDAALNPEIVLCRGQTYTFKVAARGHPFWIKTSATNLRDDPFDTGVTGNGLETGTMTFAVPATAPGTLYYNCEMHVSMTGRIIVVD